MRSLHVLSLVQSLLLLCKSDSPSTDVYGTCHESKPMEKVAGDKMVSDAMKKIHLIDGGTIEDVTFHALIHNKAQSYGPFHPDYEQTRMEALRKKIIFQNDGKLSDETMKMYFNSITATDEIYLVVHGWLDSVQSEHKIDGVCK